MKYEELIALITRRRSIRKFKETPVTKEEFEKIINSAIWAPSATNSQPWKFIATSSKEYIRKIEEATNKGISKLKEHAAKIGKEEASRKIDVFSRYALVFKDAPSMIICLSEKYSSKFTNEIFEVLGDYNDVCIEEGLKSTMLAAQNMILTIHAMGFGACALSGPMMLADEELKRVLNIEEKYKIALIIALGVPDITPNAPPRKPLNEIYEYIE